MFLFVLRGSNLLLSSKHLDKKNICGLLPARSSKKCSFTISEIYFSKNKEIPILLKCTLLIEKLKIIFFAFA
jgi:hypothetical protein